MAADFYSLRNMLEAGSIRDNDKNNQFLAAVLTSYPCLDIWVRVADDSDMEVRVLYIQKDQDYTAARPWQRDTENPKVWKQKRGEWPELLAWFINVLPSLSRLHEEKRNGLANFGDANPYAGGGLVANVNNDGSIGVLGRFGVLTVTIDGIEMPFSSFAWDFDGCEVEITVTPPDGAWNSTTIDDRPVQNTGGRNRQVINRTGSFSYVMQGGIVDAFAPSWTDPATLLATVSAEWVANTPIPVPLGAVNSIPAPIPYPSFSYGSTVYPAQMGQAYVSLAGTCNNLTQISANVYEGDLTVAPPRYAFASGSCTMEKNGVTSVSPSVQYVAGGAGSQETPGTITITRSGVPGAYTYGTQWQPSIVSTVTASFAVPTVSTDTGFSCYQSQPPAGNNMVNALQESRNNLGAGAIQYQTLNVDCDTEGALSTPPILADFPNYLPPVDTENVSAFAWRHQLTCSLP